MNYLMRVMVAMIAYLALPASAAVVILYHHVSDTTPKSTSISPAAFEAQMDYLAKNNFTVVPLLELTEKLRKGEPLPDKTVAISFDDSYASVYESAFPRLKKRGWPFTFFVNTDAVGTGKIFVNWDQLREMAKAGATIANHSSSHTHLPRREGSESAAQWRDRITQDINNAQQKIKQEIGTAPMILAYPFGEYDVDVQRIAKKLGYIAFGQQSGALYGKGDLQSVPRFPFGGSFTALDDFILKVNTKPMPLTEVEFYGDNKQKQENLIVRESEKPWLVLTLSDDSLLKKINCFATGQGAITTAVIDNKLWVQPNKPLGTGRTRYNCTAYAGEKGRFYWYTQQWLATDKQGNWTYRD
ncbi:polysaccharide deacetylase family protein [Cellvibrio sp. PSBB023]|uniref:polysaccharide deacetylase family protein n=1 Tax=Cellvibrio sp. PSBB023 TaxID=1945512 RepID=UPI00098EDE8F|nr:polysaccharide deacetylase family protein [Cellvibrio sp. PSBB023]AQT61928.1 polysaccharide deacetylase [Cellvibrio sp. PSBB023]